MADLCEKIADLLEEERYQEALSLGKAPENQKQLLQDSWDLVPNLVCPLIADNEQDKPELIQTCSDLLCHLADVCSPKELLIMLFEQIECFKDDVKLIVALLPIQKCLLRLPKARYLMLEMAFQAIFPHLDTLEAPEWSNFEGKERLLLTMDPKVIRSNNVVRALIDFLKPFVEEMSLEKQTEESLQKNQKQIQLLLFYLLEMLDHPLTYLDLTYDPESEEHPKPKSTSRYLAEKVVHMIHSIEPDSLKLVTNFQARNNRITAQKKRIKKHEEETKEVDELDLMSQEELLPENSLATLVYLVYAEDIVSNLSPLVFTPHCVLERLCFAVKHLLPSDHNLVSEKGVKVMAGLISRIPPYSLPVDFFQHKDFKVSLDHLIKLVMLGRVKTISRIAVSVLGDLYKCFSFEGRRHFFLTMFNKYDRHSGFIGHIVTKLKDELNEGLQKGVLDSHFRGISLKPLLFHAFYLPQGEKTDMMDYYDWILSSLALLRFLILRDTDNATGIWDHMDKIEKDYIEKLIQGVNLSKAHYELELHQLQTGQKRESDTIDVQVEGDMMLGLTKKQQEEACNKCLVTLDMMASVAGRVEEVIERQKKLRKEQNAAM